MQELAGFKSSRPSLIRTGNTVGHTGWSATGGQVSSAYVYGGFDAGGIPGGSSSGSAVGVCAGFAVAAIGTDTTASIVRLFPRGLLMSRQDRALYAGLAHCL